MGKREVLLVLAFTVLGAVAYRLAAPSGTGEEPGFSWAAVFDRIRGEIDGPGTWVTRNVSASAPVDEGIREISIDGFDGELRVIGTDEPDAHGELAARVGGLDEADANERAARVDLAWRVVGDSLTVEIRRLPGVRRGRSDLLLRIPARLSVRLDARGGPIAIEGVASVHLVARGDMQVTAIAGEVTGEHQRGDLRLTTVGGARLATRRSDVRAESIDGAFTLEGRDGRVRVRSVTGPLTVRTRRADVDVEDIGGPVDITHTDGRLVVQGARDRVAIEAERSDLSLRLEHAVPVDVDARERATEVFLPAGGNVTLEAIVRDGELRLDGLDLAPTGDARERRVVGPIGNGGPRIGLTVEGGDLVVRR